MATLERQRRRERDLMTAQLTAAVVNSGWSRPEKGVSAEDFMLREAKAEPEPRKSDAQDVADTLRAIMARYNPQPA